MVFMLQTLPHLDPARHQDPARAKDLDDLWTGLETFFISVFTLEYVMRFITSEDKRGFAFDFMNIIDILAIAPFYINVILQAAGGSNSGDIVYLAVLRAMRLFRVFRVLKLGKYFKAISMVGVTFVRSSAALMTLLFMATICTVLFSAGIYFAEGVGFPTHGFCYDESGVLVGDDHPDVDYCRGYSSIPSCMWWALVTMSTVGYGDVYPKTAVGKLIGIICALCGILALALPITVIGSHFSSVFAEETAREEAEEEEGAEEAGDGEGGGRLTQKGFEDGLEDLLQRFRGRENAKIISIIDGDVKIFEGKRSPSS